MVSKESRSKVRAKKHMRIRNRFSGTAERPRLAVFRSNNHVYAQVIDDESGKTLSLTLGYSHPVELEDPEGIETVVEGQTITVKGIDKEKVGQHAAIIREKRAPEPYKGKGIKYADEVIRRKVGKTGKK